MHPMFSSRYRMLAVCLALATFVVGCTYATRATLTQAQQQVIEDIVVAEEAGRLNDCRATQVDLDREGPLETVILFLVGSHGSQARALRWQGASAVTLFEDGSDTPGTAFCLAEGVPTFVLERKGSKVPLAYQWNGKAFVQAAGAGCAGRQSTVIWHSCN